MPLLNRIISALPGSFIEKIYYTPLGKQLVKLYDHLNRNNTEIKAYRLATGVVMNLYSNAPERAIIYDAYESKITSLFLSVLKNNDVVFDGGAWIGYYTILAAKVAKKVVAIDIDDGNLERIKDNLLLNHFSNVEVLQIGVSNQKGSGRVKLDKGDAMRKLDVNSDGNIEIDTLDNIAERLNLNEIGVMIMDIEGNELFALDGMTKLLQNQAVRDIIIEVHPAFISQNGRNESEISNLLTNKKYVVQKIASESPATFHLHASRVNRGI